MVKEIVTEIQTYVMLYIENIRNGSPRFMLYNLNPACTTKFLIKFTGMYKDDKQDFLPDYLKESKLKPPCLQLCILREVLVKNSQIIL